MLDRNQTASCERGVRTLVNWDELNLVNLLLAVVEQAGEVLQRPLVQHRLGLVVSARHDVTHGPGVIR